jgi:FkbM family methyltransferase
MKTEINSLLAKLGYRIARVQTDEAELFNSMCKFYASNSGSLDRAFLLHCVANAAESKAQRFQDLMADFFNLGRPGMFCEFGATDGVSLSNSWYLENVRGWTGILAEPGRRWHALLVANRPNAFVETRCVYSVSNERIMFSEAADGVYSAITEFAGNDAHQGHRQGSENYEVTTISLDDLLAERGISSLDFLSVDTEGSEYKILQAFDFGKFRPKFVAVEHNYTSNRQLLDRLLTSQGYTSVFRQLSAFDDWYVRDDILSETRMHYL